MKTGWPRAAALCLLLLAAPGCDRPAGDAGAGQTTFVPTLPDGPTAGDREYERLTASWPREALTTCGPGLRDLLGARDLVQAALDQVEDPEGRAAAGLADARRRLEEGDARLAEVRPQLERGVCDGAIQIAVDEAMQAYVKAGTAAMQAGQDAAG